MPVSTPNKEAPQPTTLRELLKSDKSTWEYIEIPQKDYLGAKHCGVRFNGGITAADGFFGPGKHFVPPALAEEIRRMLAKKDDRDLRTLRGDKDTEDLMRRGISEESNFVPLR